MLIDSDTPGITAPLWKNSGPQSCGRDICAAVVSREWFSRKNRSAVLTKELESDVTSGRVAALDAAKQQAYVPGMRRSIRPVFFPAPSPEFRPLAERLLRDATQSGVLDFPALVHAPIEKWLVSHLCRTTITPNQITLGTGILGLSVTLLYAFGYLWIGALLALLVGILDGVDGKLATESSDDQDRQRRACARLFCRDVVVGSSDISVLDQRPDSLRLRDPARLLCLRSARTTG